MLDLDLNRDGKTHGWIYIPYSTNDSGGGRLEIPVISIRNGSGPRVLCSAGVHGDEFEGQIVCGRLARTLEPAQVRGQLIVAPAVNMPSVVAGTRISPLDRGGLNQLFPGSPTGSPTERIAHCVETQLIAGSDYMIDLQGGGHSMMFLSGPEVTHDADPALMKTQLALLNAFGGPRGYIVDEAQSSPGGTFGACRRHGVVRVGTQFGGARVSPNDVAMMHAGVLRVLAHLGVIDQALTADLPAKKATIILRRGSAATPAYVFAPEEGLFVPEIEIGDAVKKGACLGEICWPEHPQKAPVAVNAEMDGVVMARRRQGRGRRGDCLVLLAEPGDIPTLRTMSVSHCEGT